MANVLDSANRIGAARPVRVPATRRPQAHPGRNVAIGRVAGGVTSCRVTRPVAAQPAPWLLKLKLVAVALLTVAGVATATAGFVAQAQPDSQVRAVPGDPAWAHVYGLP